MNAVAAMVVLPMAALYCAIRAAFDFRHKRYLLGAVGVALTLGLLMVPIATHAVRVDLPQR